MEINEVLTSAPSLIDLQLVLEENAEQMRKPHLLISRYNHEKATNKDYNGRQLLELIQNADDAGSAYVAIELDKTAHRLRISNSGTPFTMEGFRSLMVPNLSSKIKKHYIGNKGLGFRSVLNWSEEVTVYSAGLRVRFSREKAAQYFSEWYSVEEQTSIRTEYGLAPQVVPFPLFAVPEIDEQSLYSGQTVIDIRYREGALEHIEPQLKELQPEVLLFLNHISEIRVSGTENDRLDRVDWVGAVATIGQRSWTVYDNKIDGKDPQLPPEYKDADALEQEFYSLKIALQQGLKDEAGLLFSFFPTKITLNFPAVVHGTFELDSSRNRIIESEKNKFLAGELLKMLFRVAMQLDGWDRFRLLNYREQSDAYLKKLDFYQQIDNFLRVNAVLPCADGELRTYASVRVLPPVLTRLIIDLARQADFAEMLSDIPADLRNRFGTLFPFYATEKAYIPSVLIGRIEQASAVLFGSVTSRVYAGWLAAVKPQFSTPAPRMLKVLYDDKGKLSDTSVSLFTPSSGSRIIIPPHVNIEYLHPDLYRELLTTLNFNDLNPPRRLKQELSNFAEVQSFEPVPVLQKIISETKTALDGQTDRNERRRLVKEMMASLYGYYIHSDKAKNTELRVLGIPVISVSGSVITAREAFLSEHYAAGQLRRALFGDLYTTDELIAAPDELGIAETNDTERFLVDFIGINRFAALAYYDGSTKFDRAYQQFVFNAVGKPERFREARVSGTYIRNYDALKQAMNNGRLSPEQFIAWLCIDDEVRELAARPGETKFDYVNTNQQYGTYPHTINTPPNYLRYQLAALGGFSDFVQDTDNIDYLNPFRFDLSAAYLQGHGITSDRIREAQRLAGAKNLFGELSLTRIADILRSMPKKDPAGKYARKIYQLCANRFRDKQQALADKAGLELHGTQDGQKRYTPWSEVYYNRKISLPARITAGKTLLNFPKRGAENNITGFFKVSTFDNIDFVSQDHTPNAEATEALSVHLRRIRPLILVERLSSLESSGEKREAVRLVKTLNIVLCQQLIYSLDGEMKEADPYDFIESAKDKHTWLIRYAGAAGILDLISDFRLCDVVSEIWSIVFDLSNITGEISSIYRNDLAYSRHRLRQIHGDEEMAEAESYLEVSEAERQFWRLIGALCDVDAAVFDAAEEGDYRLLIAGALGIDRLLMAGIDYSDLNYPDNLNRFQVLFKQLQISLAGFNQSFQLNLSFYTLHLGRWERLAVNEQPRLNAAYWQECNSGDRLQQAHFIAGTAILARQIAEPLAQLYKDEVEPVYNDLLEAAIKARFPDVTAVPDYQAVYQKNLRSLPAINFEINSWSPADRSLLYFQLTAEDLERLREKLQAQRPAPDSTDTSKEDEEEATPEVTDLEKAPAGADRTPPGSDPSKQGHGGGGGGGFGSGSDADKRALGLRAEKMVLLSLKGKTWQWMSGYSNDPSKNDRAGYDIRYKEPNDQDWTYIEVKWFESGLFRLPDTEFNFAKLNADRYYIYLVTPGNIRKVLFRDLIDEDGEFIRQNDYFAYAVSEYKFKRLN